ncbi:hypothetical protein BD408DRAFT_352865 [Parasitella parasitica]|nr:hypothetical protein BD408DRAFT_352865 [Parasitella parasitica]
MATTITAEQQQQQQQEEANAQLASQDVGLIFVREYYTFLNKKPNRLHAFYNKDSTFVRGDEGTLTNTIKGQEEIRKKIEECKFEDCKVLITQVDSQTSANNGILIQALGEMCNQNGPSQKFSQTFFLATQPNGYYVLNDIFRFLKDEVEIDYYTVDHEEAGSAPAVPTAVTPIVNNIASPAIHQQTPPTPSQDAAVGNATTTVVSNDDNTAASPVVTQKSAMATQQHETPVAAITATPDAVPSSPANVAPKKESETAPVAAKPTAPKTWANLTAATPATNGIAIDRASTTATAGTSSASTVTSEKPSVANAQPQPQPQRQPQQQQQQQSQPQQQQPQQQQLQPQQQQQQQQHHQHSNKNQQARKVYATQIFVKLVNESINEDQLIEVFSEVGTVKSCSIVRQKNCAFVEFNSPESCQKALLQHKFPVHGHTVLAEERRYNNNQQRYNNTTPFDPRRSSNNTNSSSDRKGHKQNRQNQGGKGKGALTSK